MFFSKITGGFYSKEIHGINMPEDVVEINEFEHAELMQAQSAGAIISANEDGYPVAVFPPPPTQEELIAIASEAVRRALQSAIDTKARELGFSSGDSVIQYAGWPNSYQDMAIAFGNWEVSVWLEAGAYRAQVLAGEAPMLTPEEAVAMMPELLMPS